MARRGAILLMVYMIAPTVQTTLATDRNVGQDFASLLGAEGKLGKAIEWLPRHPAMFLTGEYDRSGKLLLKGMARVPHLSHSS
jgi:hypothetical protein